MTNLLTKYKGLWVATAYAILCVALVIIAAVYASYMLVNHWLYIAKPCVECVTTFTRHMLAPSHILPLALMSWAIYAITKAVQYINKEYTLHKAYKYTDTKSNSINLVYNAPLAAWSSGLTQPKVYADASFWNSLTVAEKKALYAHEQHHIYHLEVLQFFLIGLAKAIMPLPFLQQKIGSILHGMRYTSEFAADKAAIEHTSRKTLASLLIKAVLFEKNTIYTTAPGIDSFLQNRIEHITNNTFKKTGALLHKDQLALMALLSIVCTLLLSTYIFIQPLQSCLI